MKPMLACNCGDVSEIRFPVIATPKIDGLRCLILDGKPITRSGKLHPNQFIQSVFREVDLSLDGELIVQSASFSELSGQLRRHDSKPDFVFRVFDFIDLTMPYKDRIEVAENFVRHTNLPIEYVQHEWIFDEQELTEYERNCLSQGYEGIMFRQPNSRYKMGRSTWREQGLVKVKRFAEDEAVIIGMNELLSNQNPAFVNELGLTSRSKRQENLIPAGIMGSLVVRDIKTNVVFEIGTGFTHNMREEMWRNQKDYINQVCTYKHQPYGAKDKPRCPVFKSIRWDLL